MTRDPITLRAARELHREWLDEMTKLAKTTKESKIGAYNTLIRFLRDHLKREPLTSDWTRENMTLYFRKYVSQLKAFDQKRMNTMAIESWLMGEGYIPWGPPIVGQAIPLRRDRKDADPRDRRLTDSEFLKLLKVALAHHPRDYYLCLFVRLTGRRIREVVDMVWGDIRWEDDDMRWDNSKAHRRGQRMPLTPAVRAVLREWATVIAGECKIKDEWPPNSWPLFPTVTATGRTMRGRRRQIELAPPFKIGNKQAIIHRLLVDSGLWEQDGDGWHILRKTVGNRLRQTARADGRGDSMELASRMLDHESTEVTRVYISADDEYEALKAYMMDAKLIDDEVMAQIPALAGLVEQEKASAVVADAQEIEQVDAPGAVILDLTSRRRLRALG